MSECFLLEPKQNLIIEQKPLVCGQSTFLLLAVVKWKISTFSSGEMEDMIR